MLYDVDRASWLQWLVYDFREHSFHSPQADCRIHVVRCQDMEMLQEEWNAMKSNRQRRVKVLILHLTYQCTTAGELQSPTIEPSRLNLVPPLSTRGMYLRLRSSYLSATVGLQSSGILAASGLAYFSRQDVEEAERLPDFIPSDRAG